MIHKVKPHLEIFSFVVFHGLFLSSLPRCGYSLFLDCALCMNCERRDSEEAER